MTTRTTTEPAFRTWLFAGTLFLAAPAGKDSDHIMDCAGNNYGRWQSVKGFRKRQQSGMTADWQSLGRAHLSIVSEHI